MYIHIMFRFNKDIQRILPCNRKLCSNLLESIEIFRHKQIKVFKDV